MDKVYIPEEKFLSKNFTLAKSEMKDWISDAMWEGLKDCFRTPICEQYKNDIVFTEHIVGFVRTLYVDDKNDSISFEGLFWPKYSYKNKEQWENVEITGVSFYTIGEENPNKIPVSCFYV